MCQGIHRHEPHKETHRDSECVESITLWSMWYHLKSDASKITYKCVLCDIGLKFSHCMKKHMKLYPVENLYQCALCDIGLKFSHCKKKHMKLYPVENLYQCALCGKWRVMLWTIRISVLCVTKTSSPETTQRDTTKAMLWIIHIHKLSVSRNSSPSTTPRDIWTWIKGNSILLFCLIFKNYCNNYSALVTSSADKKTSWEYTATQSLQHTIVCCWWILVINYLCITNFV